MTTPSSVPERWDFVTKMPDLTGKVALVTGANSPGGIGFHIAQQLSNKGAKVYVGARTSDKAQFGIEELVKANPHVEARPFVADMADLKQVKAAASALMDFEDRLDIIVNNAGIGRPPEEQTDYGVSLNYAANHLGPFVLVRALKPLLKKTADASPGVRVVTVSSGWHTMVPAGSVDYVTKDSFNTLPPEVHSDQRMMVHYCASKLANILYAQELQKKLDAAGIAAVALSLDPGNVCTDGSKRTIGEEMAKTLPFQPIDGATTSLFAATAPEVRAEKDKYGGAYLVPFGQIASGSAMAQDEVLAKKLWDLSESVVQEVLAS